MHNSLIFDNKSLVLSLQVIVFNSEKDECVEESETIMVRKI